jgi:hypothetical protein
MNAIVTEGVAHVLELIGPLELNEYLTRRLENVISARLRTVRNAEQTMAILARDEKIGGVGLPPEKVEKISTVIEHIREEWQGRLAEEEKKRIQKAEIAQKERLAQRHVEEQEAHAQWYAEKVRAQINPEEQLRALLQTETPKTASPSSVVVDGIRGTVAPRMISGDSVGELASMDVEHFRRLSPSSDEAAEKIWQKLEALRQESFDRWTKGVTAWRQAPIQQSYLLLVQRSFLEGKPVAEIAERMHAQDLSQLSPVELASLLQLNGRIHL